MEKLNEQIGSVKYDDLFAGAFPEAEVFSVTIRALDAEKTLERGTVLALSSKDGKMVVLGTTAGGEETLEANCVLTDTVTVGTDDVNAVAYRTGHFNRQKLVVKDEYQLTASDEESLRKGGILLSDAIGY